MTISRNFGFFRNKRAGYGGTPADFPAFEISVSYSGKSNTFTRDNHIISYSITSNVKNTNIYYTIEDLNGNLQADDFTDNTLSGTISLDANGSGSLTKTLVKSIAGSEGHKKFKLRLRRTSITGTTLKESANTQVYEIIPISATGGNTTIVPFTTTGFGSVLGAKFHSFSNTATETFTLSNYGNYTGNANIWVDQFVTPQFSYWNQHIKSDETGLRFRNMIIGGGGAGFGGNGGGAGEIGFWSLPLGNIAVGSYSMKTSPGILSQDTAYVSDMANTVAFVGNVTLGITAFGGGRGGVQFPNQLRGSPGGCGGGSGAISSSNPGGFTAFADGKSQLPTKTSIYYPNSYLAGWGFTSSYPTQPNGGGGGVTAIGNTVSKNGGQGWSANSETNGYLIDAQWRPNITPIQYAGGGGADSGGIGAYGGGNDGQTGTKGTGGGGGGGANGGSGLIAIRYPYAAPYRFATANVIV